MAAYVLLLLEWAGVARQPLSVSFQHDAPIDRTLHHSVFGADVSFGAAFNELRFPAAWLARPIASHDDALFTFLERRARELGEGLESRDLLEAIRDAVATALPSGVPSLEVVARSIGTGHRTLQRRLQAHETSYRALVDDVRFQRCKALLREDDLTVDAVSSQLGFSEARAFRRAVRRWSGLSPRGLRATLG